MRKLFLKSILLLCALIVGSSSLWGATKTLIYSVTSKTEVTLQNASTGSYSGTVTFSNTDENNNDQMTSGSTMTLTLANFPSGVTKVSLNLHRNSSKGGGTISIKHNNVSIGSGSKNKGDLTNSYSNYDFSCSDSQTEGDLVVLLTSTENSFWCNQFTITYDDTPTYNISTAVNDANMGSVSVNGKTITASPNSGYRVMAGNDGYTITAGTATVSHEGHSNTLTVSPSTDCTVRVNFEGIPSHTASFVINGTFQNYSYREGDDITFADDIPSINGKAFVGWASTPIVGTTDEEPSLVTSATMNTTNVTFYAVFATENVNYEWHKETDLSKIGAGVYALITPDGHAFNGTISSGHGQASTSAFSFTNGVATSAPSGTLEITITAMTGGFSMYNSSKGYLYAKAASSGNLAWDTKTATAWSYNSSNWKHYATGAYLRSYNNSSFRTYSTNNGAALAFAKKVAVAIYSDYCTDIALAYTAHDPDLSFAAYDETGTYWATFSDEDNVTFFPATHNTDKTTEIYTVSVQGGVMSLNALTPEDATISASDVNGYFVPANTGVLIKCSSSSAPYYTVANKYVAPLENNMLYPGKGETIDSPASCKYYLLGYGDAVPTRSTLGFYYGAEGGAAFKARNGGAYLAVPTTTLAPARFLITDEENNATDIKSIEANDKAVKFIQNGQLLILRDGITYDALGRVVK